LHFFVDFKEWATPHYVLLLILRSGLPLLLICQIDPGLNLLYKKWHKTCYTLSITYSIDKSGSPLLGTISVGHTVYYRKPGSLANNNVNCIGFYWYKFNKLRKCYEMLKNISDFLVLTFFQSVFLLQKGTSFS
jgi:hypothetical protein